MDTTTLALLELARYVAEPFATVDSLVELLISTGAVPEATRVPIDSSISFASLRDCVEAVLRITSEVRDGLLPPSPQVVFDALRQLIDVVKGLNTTHSIIGALIDGSDRWTSEISDIIVHLVGSWWSHQFPLSFQFLLTAGVWRIRIARGATPLPAGVFEFHPEVLPLLLDPPRLAREQLRLDGSEDFEIARFVDFFSMLMSALGLGGSYGPLSPPIRQEYWRESLRQDLFMWTSNNSSEAESFPIELSLLPIPNASDRIGGFVFRAQLAPSALSGIFPSSLLDVTSADGLLSLDFRVDARGAAASLSFPDPARGIRVKLHLAALFSTSGERSLLVGSPQSSHARVGDVVAEFSTEPSGGFSVGVLFSDCSVVFSIPTANGVLSHFLPSGRDSTLRFSIGASWSTASGFRINGNVGMRVSIPIVRTSTLAELRDCQFALEATDTKLQTSLSIAVAVRFGPLQATARRFGVALTLGSSAEPQSEPNVFGIGGGWRFLVPSAFSLAISAPACSGAGLVELDSAHSRYVGGLSLEFARIALTAFVLVQSPSQIDPSSFSIVAALFLRTPPIPLGLGFSLRGVGGAFGIHRRIDVSAIRSAFANGRLDALVGGSVSGGDSTVSQLSAFMPEAQHRHILLPSALFAYGSPATKLFDITLAVAASLPAPVVFMVLGKADGRFPELTEPVVELHFQILGIVDFAERIASIDASLNDSRIGPLNLYGDLAFRLGWSDQPYFLLSIGGFNPHFQAPSNFPTLRRLTLGYTAPGGLVRLRIESYFAITSNTLQLGARVEVQVRVEIVSIDGMLAFDALVIFSPFSFRIDFLASLSVTVFGAKLLAIHLEGTIKGPKPWHITGKARLSVLFIEAAVDVDVKFGGEPSLEELPAVDPTDRLLEALRAPASWKGEPMAGVSRPVSLSDASNSQTPLFDPVGVPAVRQTIVPLNRKLDRYAEGRIGGPGRYDVRAARVGSASATHRPAHELFAAAQFEQMTDAEKLSRPSFEKMDAGALLASEAISVGPKAQGAGLFEQIKLGDDETPTTATLPSEQIFASSRSGAASLRGLRVQGADRFAPPPGSAPRVALADELYVAVRRDSLRPAERATPETAGAASALVQLLAEESGSASLFQVAPAFEATGGEGR